MALILLDTASLYYRAYFALPESMTAPDGRPVNAVRGLIDTIATLVRERGPAQVVACWDDDWRPQWRVDLIPSYKTHRLAAGGDTGVLDLEETPDTLAPQIDIIADLLPALGIPIVGQPACEADDVIATLAHDANVRTDIASGDRDLVQLVNDQVTLLFTGGSSASRGGRPWLEVTPPVAHERFGVPPSLYADLAILRGDPSDGLPGVKGIGEKTAVALVSAYGPVSAVVAAAEDPLSGRPMTPGIRAKLLAASDDIARADKVVRLRPRDRPMWEWPPVRPDGLALADSWGVGSSVRRLMDAFGRST